MIKTVIFDLGGVIVPLDFKKGFSRMGEVSSCPPDEIPTRLLPTGLVQQFEAGKLEGPEFFEKIKDLLEIRATYDEFCGIWSSIFLPDTYIPQSMLEGIKKERRLLLLSNTNSVHFQMLRETYPLLSVFDELVLSYEVGATKPSPVIYKAAIRAAGCAAEECFFTDDIAAYVEGAKQEGIDAVQFESLEQIQGELRARGVTW